MADNVLDIHIILQKPYPQIMNETEQMLWERNSKPGKAQQYKAETIRFALNMAHKFLSQERERMQSAEPVPVGSTAE